MEPYGKQAEKRKKELSELEAKVSTTCRSIAVVPSGLEHVMSLTQICDIVCVRVRALICPRGRSLQSKHWHLNEDIVQLE